jgi:hypothetical protein
MTNSTNSTAQTKTNNIESPAQASPKQALELSTQETLQLLRTRLSDEIMYVLNPDIKIESPLRKRGFSDSQWLKHTNIVGINIRTVQNFWNVVKYVLTLPKCQEGIHMLPIWEPGVVASLYGISSWRINPEFFSIEMHQTFPHLDSVEKQLKVVMNILHSMGKVVGMDVIPHTDRFSEQVLANPRLFEWLKRSHEKILSHNNNLYQEAENLIFNFTKINYPTGNLPAQASDFFSENYTENERCHLLFGETWDYWQRLNRREELIEVLYAAGLETAPATMGPPYRGLELDMEQAPIEDKKGRLWRDYKISHPQAFTRVFGPLTRFKFYENKADNAHWEIDFSKPIHKAFTYFAQHYAQIQSTYNFDFMRGDMAHVQMRPNGVPTQVDSYYDILGFTKQYIAQQTPYFASFAETFLAPANAMAYGDEIDHLELTQADVTLGDLQSLVVGSKQFFEEFRRYIDIAQTRLVVPCFTLMTADKDDPRFDNFYLQGNEARYFTGLFLTDMPSYMALGFELRDPHPTPAPNEHYTKLYVFQIEEGEKATSGNYVWGRNYTLFDNLCAIQNFADSIFSEIKFEKPTWLLPPDPTGARKVVAWAIQHRLFVVNLDVSKPARNIKIPPPKYFQGNGDAHLQFAYTEIFPDDNTLVFNGMHFALERLQAGESRVYAV